MTPTIILLIVLIVLLVLVLIGLMILKSSIEKVREEIKDVASGVSVLAQVGDQNAKALSLKIEKTFAETFAEINKQVDILPKYDDNDLYDEVESFVETEGFISIETIQKTFHVGYSRAIETIEALVTDGIIEKFENPNSNHAVWSLVKDEDEEYEEDES